MEKDFAMSLSLNITLKRFEIFSHERDEECDNTIFKHHRIYAFVTADMLFYMTYDCCYKKCLLMVELQCPYLTLENF